MVWCLLRLLLRMLIASLLFEIIHRLHGSIPWLLLSARCLLFVLCMLLPFLECLSVASLLAWPSLGDYCSLVKISFITHVALACILVLGDLVLILLLNSLSAPSMLSLWLSLMPSWILHWLLLLLSILFLACLHSLLFLILIVFIINISVLFLINLSTISLFAPVIAILLSIFTWSMTCLLLRFVLSGPLSSLPCLLLLYLLGSILWHVCIPSMALVIPILSGRLVILCIHLIANSLITHYLFNIFYLF